MTQALRQVFATVPLGALLRPGLECARPEVQRPRDGTCGLHAVAGHLFSADHRYRHHVRVNFGHFDSGYFEAALKSVGTIAEALA